MTKVPTLAICVAACREVLVPVVVRITLVDVSVRSKFDGIQDGNDPKSVVISPFRVAVGNWPVRLVVLGGNEVCANSETPPNASAPLSVAEEGAPLEPDRSTHRSCSS